MIRLNQDSWHYKFYEWVNYDRDLPQDVCTYLWGLIFSCFVGACCFFMCSVILVVPITVLGILVVGVLELQIDSFFEAWCCGIFSLVIIVIAASLTVYLSLMLLMYSTNWLVPIFDSIVDSLNSFKDKYCTKIDWIQNDK